MLSVALKHSATNRALPRGTTMAAGATGQLTESPAWPARAGCSGMTGGTCIQGHSKGLLPDFLTSQCNPAGLSKPTPLPAVLPETRPSRRPFQDLQLHGPAARDLPFQGLCTFLLQSALSILPIHSQLPPSPLSFYPLPVTPVVRAPSPAVLCRGAASGQSCLSEPGTSCQEPSLSQEPSPDQQHRPSPSHCNHPSGGFADEPINLRHSETIEEISQEVQVRCKFPAVSPEGQH